MIQTDVTTIPGSYCHVVFDVSLVPASNNYWSIKLNSTVARLQSFGAKKVKCDCSDPENIHMDCWLPVEEVDFLKKLDFVTVVNEVTMR